MRKALFMLGELEDQDIVWLSRNGHARQLQRGETLIAVGREVHDLYFVTDGTLTVADQNGRPIATLALGDVVGEMSFVEKRLPSASVTAAEAARVLAVPRDRIITAFADNKDFAARFYRSLAIFLSDRLRTATGGVEEEGELDDAVLDTVSDAGSRFIRLLDLLEGRIK